MADFALYFASIFSIVNPFAAIPVYLAMTEGTPVEIKRGIPRKAAVASTAILLGAYAAGASLLTFFSISIASLRVAGGILIFSMAWAMLQARQVRQKQTPEEAEEASHRDSLAIVPLAMPLLAGPGGISVMILWSARNGPDAHVPAVAAVAAVAVSIWVILGLATPISKVLGQTGMNVATRFMGLILAAVAVEFVTGGLRELFPGWARG